MNIAMTEWRAIFARTPLRTKDGAVVFLTPQEFLAAAWFRIGAAPYCAALSVWTTDGRQLRKPCFTMDEARNIGRMMRDVARLTANLAAPKRPLPPPRDPGIRARLRDLADSYRRFENGRPLADHAEEVWAEQARQECAEEGWDLAGWDPQECLLLRLASSGSVPIRGTVYGCRTVGLSGVIDICRQPPVGQGGHG